MLIIYFLILLFSHNINALVQCVGQCYYNNNNNNCVPNVNVYIQCYPLFDAGTFTGCSTPPLPTITKSCSHCNGYGNSCPYNCTVDLKSNKTCIGISNEAICESMYAQWKCPANCIYDEINHKCNPLNVNDVCNHVSETTVCPQNCFYNEHQNNCISHNINHVCQLKKGLICPLGCSNNPDGTECVTTSTIYPCSYVSIPICSSGCSFNSIKNRCMPILLGTDCEPITKIQCPINYVINYTTPNCNLNNVDDICIYKGITQYPDRLLNKYNNLKCKYNYTIDCTIIYTQKISLCPSGCTIDVYHNRCISPSTKYMCGSFDLISPTGTTCPNKYRMLNISGSDGKQINKCGPIWYHGN
jgi:hypothetical protein